MWIGNGVQARPTRDYGAACAAFERLAARDGPEISDVGRSRFFGHGKRTARAVVLLHGLTNAPAQWVPFAERLHAHGDTVVIPRFPGHGFANRRTHRIARVHANDFLGIASEAVDIACGAGERVVLAGLSIGGAIAAWLALARAELDRSVAVVPFLGVARLPERGNRILTTALVALPNAFIPWDPGGGNKEIPPYAYASFPTHVLGACLAVGLDALRRSATQAPRGRLELALNAREPACNNALAEKMNARLRAQRPDASGLVVWPDLPPIHDIVDPSNPHGRTDLVYPRLRALVDG